MNNFNDESSFFSMDRLIEFGMGMAMSQQIVNNMNNMMSNISMPKQINPLQNINTKPVTIPEVYYVAFDNKQNGPYSGTEIARLVLEKKVTANTYVWKTGMTEWKHASDFPDLVTLISMIPPELPQTK